MKTAEAVQVINNLSYRPGWHISAQWSADADAVELTVSFDTVDTDQDCALRGYDKPKRIEATYGLDARMAQGPADIMAFVMATIAELELHESREFLRNRADGMKAPFHPHRPEGEALWTEYFG